MAYLHKRLAQLVSVYATSAVSAKLGCQAVGGGPDRLRHHPSFPLGGCNRRAMQSLRNHTALDMDTSSNLSVQISLKQFFQFLNAFLVLTAGQN